MNLLVNEATKADVSSFKAKPGHALLITGMRGSGKLTLAKHIASELLVIEIDKLDSYAYFKHVAPVRNNISIDQIRELQPFISLRTPGTNEVRRLIIIENADNMNVEAQNAFLKLLEEPPADTVIILTAANLRQLLPTIQSRVQQMALKNPSKQDVGSYFIAEGYSEQAIKHAYSLSEGRLGIMAAILADSEEHELVKAVNEAKKILGSNAYERLQMVDSLARNKEELPSVLEALKRISRVMMMQASQNNDTKQITSWHKRLKAIHKSQAALERNAQSKLVLTDLFLNL